MAVPLEPESFNCSRLIWNPSGSSADAGDETPMASARAAGTAVSASRRPVRVIITFVPLRGPVSGGGRMVSRTGHPGTGRPSGAIRSRPIVAAVVGDGRTMDTAE